jgi:hypothetical protein
VVPSGRHAGTGDGWRGHVLFLATRFIAMLTTDGSHSPAFVNVMVAVEK